MSDDLSVAGILASCGGATKEPASADFAKLDASQSSNLWASASLLGPTRWVGLV